MTTMHPANDVLLAHSDGELSDIEEAQVARHVAGCADCVQTLARLRETADLFAGVLHGIDASEPDAWSATPAETGILPFPVAARRVHAARTARSEQPARAETVRRAALPAAWRWAAGILLFTGAAAAATLVVRPDLFRDSPSVVATPAVSPGDAPESGGGAVAVRTVDGTVLVALANADAATRIELVLDDRTDVRVSVEGPATPHFTARDGRVDVDLAAGAARVRVAVPRSAGSARVTVDGVTIVTLQEGVVSPSAAAAGGVTLEAVTGRQPMP